ncbi:glycoside hydrolase family 63 protein [Clavulina sp. PMI_390]|nr:glycoside hydrolase family 63 protein [Clavulina sp. PMI_390]
MRRPSALLVAACVSLGLGARAAGSTAEQEHDSLFWGTYRPNLYFGLRPRVPNTLMTGLMWHGLNDYQSFQKTRHACDQGDELKGYTWTELDLRHGGIQVLNDTLNNVQITTEWLKVPGGEHGGSWAARIKGKPLLPGRPSKTSVYFYMGMDGLGSLELDNEEDDTGLTGTVKFNGVTPDLGDFEIRIVDGDDVQLITEGAFSEDFEDRLGKTSFIGLPVEAGKIWTAKELLVNDVLRNAQRDIQKYQAEQTNPPEPAFILTLSNEVYTGASLFAIQKSFEGEFSFDIYYDSLDSKQRLDAQTVTNGVEAFKDVFDDRFKDSFPLPRDINTPEYFKFAKSMASNLIGGIGYFYGDSIVDYAFMQEWDDEEAVGNAGGSSAQPTMVEPRGLLTATPSRSFFPRGFYWDEGFHLLIVGAWDNDLSLEILKSWIDLIDDDGWVGREQILGPEARSKVPTEFQTQYPSYANPPTLTMAVTAFIERLRAAREYDMDDPMGLDRTWGSTLPQRPFALDSSNPGSSLLKPDEARAYLRSIYPALRRHYDWFRRTQRGQIKQWGRRASSRTEAYRWRGRTEDHVLTSGLDDYPRAKPPHVGELHIDLISWMAFFTRTMRGIAEFAGEVEDEANYKEIEAAILQNIEDLHWSEEHNMYCDASVDEDDESYHVCHKGYISIFPFMLGLLQPDSPRLGAILDMIRNPDELWSPYGIRSLSLDHPLFGQGEDYWRGPIWMQMNYLVLSALYKNYIPNPGPHQAQAKKIYDELRMNIIQNVYKEYARTGYVWEQYDSKTGEGRRSHPFTGWTSMVALSESSH